MFITSYFVIAKKAVSNTDILQQASVVKETMKHPYVQGNMSKKNAVTIDKCNNLDGSQGKKRPISKTYIFCDSF